MPTGIQPDPTATMSPSMKVKVVHRTGTTWFGLKGVKLLFLSIWIKETTSILSMNIEGKLEE